MPDKSGRVLGRLGARELTEKESAQVSGGIITGRCTFVPKTGFRDGDCEPPPP